LGLIGVFTFGVIRVGVVGVLSGRGWDGIRGGSCVFVFLVGLYRVYDGLGIGCYLIGGRVADGGKVWLVFGPGLEAGRGFFVFMVAFWVLFYRASSFFRIVSMSLRFALLMIKAIDLRHREGVSSRFGVSVRWRTFVARAGVGVSSGCGPGSGGARGVGFCVVSWYVVFGWPICADLWGVLVVCRLRW